MKDALDEFQRMVKHEQWDKAFEALAAISEKKTEGFIDRGDGVLVPSGLLVRGLLAELPSAGKSAYRLFYDAEAARLWANAVGKAELENLSAIVANHAISSVGDRAADRLGDLYFERGDFEQAAGTWQSILTYCPDSKIPKSQTLVKLAMALARGGRWTEFREIEQMVGERYAGEEVEIGGRRVTAGEQITELASSAAGPDASAPSALPDDFDLPKQNEPLWRFRFTGTDGATDQGNPFQLADIYGRPRPNDFVIPAAADERRVYVNVFGVEMAFDLETGKLVWRSGKLHLLNLQQARQGAAPERYTMNVYGDRTWSVGRDPQQASQQGPFTLTVRDAASGKEIFSSRRSLSSWSILGAPYLIEVPVTREAPSAGSISPSAPRKNAPQVGDVAYVGAQRNRQGRELSLLVLNAADGKLLKTVNIGSYAVDQNQIYNGRVARPTLVLNQDRLYVDTHAGAVAMIDPQDGNIDWAVLYESPAPPTGYYYEYVPPPCDVSGPLVVGGLIFSKGMSSSRLFGIAGDGPKVAWNRPVAESAVLVGADDERIYLGGEELTAYSLKTQELVWATRLPRSADWSVPLVTKNRLYQFTSRGVCAVDKARGDIVGIFRGDDLDSLGGSMFVARGKLVTVSNMGITAYSLDEPPREARSP
ncbi:MAG: PQQ-binding-like beta-propeller repeat protein [Pirellulales bacterium]